MHAGKSNSDFTYLLTCSKLVTATFEDGLGIVRVSSSKTSAVFDFCSQKASRRLEIIM